MPTVSKEQLRQQHEERLTQGILDYYMRTGEAARIEHIALQQGLSLGTVRQWLAQSKGCPPLCVASEVSRKDGSWSGRRPHAYAPRLNVVRAAFVALREGKTSFQIGACTLNVPYWT